MTDRRPAPCSIYKTKNCGWIISAKEVSYAADLHVRENGGEVDYLYGYTFPTFEQARKAFATW